jgi:hypothetical protein
VLTRGFGSQILGLDVVITGQILLFHAGIGSILA